MRCACNGRLNFAPARGRIRRVSKREKSRPTPKKLRVSFGGTSRLKAAVEKAIANIEPERPAAPIQRRTAADFEGLHDQLVVYVDVLGVGARLRAAKTGAALFEVFRTICEVQRLLDVPSHARDPAEKTASNEDVGKRVIALSDGIVMAVDPISRASADHDPFDVLSMELEIIIYAQGLLAERGIFLRGGISHGRFYFEDDVLVSPALAEAYYLESKVANGPRIIIGAKTAKWLKGLEGAYAYGRDLPTTRSLRPAEDIPGGFQMLDYLPVLANARDTDWVDHADLVRYRTAKDSDTKQAVLNLQAKKAARRTFELHRSAVRKAAARIRRGRVLEKYAWLMRYHNEVVHGFWREFHDCKFRPAEISSIMRRAKRDVD